MIKPFSNLFDIFANLNLYKKLIVSYFFLILFPLFTVGALAYQITSLSIKSDVSKYISEVLQQVNDNIDNSITELERMASVISVDREVQKILQKDRNRPIKEFIADDEDMNRKIDAITSLQPNLEAFFIFSYNGEVYRYRGINNSIDPDYTFTSTRWFSTMKALNQKMLLLPTHIQDQVISAGLPKKVFTYIKEITDMDSRKPIGYLMIDMNTKLFKNILDKMNVKQYQELVIIDNNKTILYHTKEEYISTQFRSKYISELLKTKRGSMIAKVNNKSVMVTYNTSLSTNWTVISIIPIDILYTKVSYLEYVIVFTVIYFLLLSFLISVVISYNITKPISDLRKLMKKAESGQFDVQIPVKTKDEIGELSDSFNSMINKTNNLIQTVYETKILKREAELNALQSQINPHFLFNTLQIMDLIAEDEGVEVISLVCQSLSRIFRYSINTGKEVVPLSSEIEHVKNYIYIQKLRFKDRFNVIYNIDENILNNKIIKLVLQPLVENALLHGIENKEDSCVIIISARKAGDHIELTVEDDGIGMDEELLDQLRRSLNEEIVHAEVDGYTRRSIGIKNVHARIRLYFGESYGVEIDSRLNVGTTIKVTFPSITWDVGGKHGDSQNSDR